VRRGFSVENSHFTEIYSCSEAGSHFRRIDFVYHSTLGLGAIKKKKKKKDAVSPEAKWNRRREWEGRISSANTYDLRSWTQSNYYTFAFILLVTIVLYSKFP
jgi:hypothetical protein